MLGQGSASFLASPLVLIQVAIRDLVRGLPVLPGPPRSDANADLDGLSRPSGHTRFANRRLQARPDLARTLELRFGHRDPELIAADACADVRNAHHALKLLGDETESRIAGAMTMTIIDALQVVEIDHHQRERAVVSLGQRHLALHPQLCAEGVPAITEAAIDTRLRAPDGGDGGLDVWSFLTSEVFDLVKVETRGVGEPEASPLLQPECACIETQGRKGLDQRHF